ncbi:MAG: Lrp/AsnC family transcriptional regulator [Pseudomonadota bacterium]
MARTLDELDRKILRELRGEARLTQLELAERVGLSPTACTRRVRLMEENDVITGYRASINEANLGFGFSVFISVKLDHQVQDRLMSFEAAVNRFPEVVDCWLMTGSRDYLLRIAVKDLVEFEDFLTRHLTSVPGVASIESSIPIRRVKASEYRLR